MPLINELESNLSRVYTLTDEEINQALTYYKKAGYNFNIPEIRGDQLTLISDIAYVSSRSRKELQDILRHLRKRFGQYKINLTKNTEDLRYFLYKSTCRFSV